LSPRRIHYHNLFIKTAKHHKHKNGYLMQLIAISIS
jgi:hypothetical protein